MAAISMLDTIRDALAAGFTPSQAATYGAISQAESGLDPNAQGDIALETAVWGPSVGEPQIRTLRAATGTGSDRDESRLLGHPVEQAKAAWDISGHGTNWSPWSTFTSGAYQRYLPAARAAVAQAAAHPGSTATATPVGITSALTSGITDQVQHIVILGIFVLLGVGMVGAGAFAATQSTRVGREATQAALTKGVMA